MGEWLHEKTNLQPTRNYIVTRHAENAGRALNVVKRWINQREWSPLCKLLIAILFIDARASFGCLRNGSSVFARRHYYMHFSRNYFFFIVAVLSLFNAVVEKRVPVKELRTKEKWERLAKWEPYVLFFIPFMLWKEIWFEGNHWRTNIRT